jgi:K+-sensing histidine kinase KdpD
MLKLNSCISSKGILIVRYAVTVVLVIGAAICLSLMESHWKAGAPVALFLFAVIISSWFGGTKPGFLAMSLSILAFDYSFQPPLHSQPVEPAQLARLILFAILAPATNDGQSRRAFGMTRARRSLLQNGPRCGRYPRGRPV